MKEQIQDKLEQIDSHVRWLSDRMDRYFHALNEISMCNDQTNATYLRGVAIAALDGEPTTADEFNIKWVSPHDPGDENNSSENKWHDTNAQIVAYDKSMTNEEE